ncbi:hypothetical protein FISHEDRAFT_40970 [Fistulina hepatica ATCC 64428]|uniref:Chromo domain-containing protein n=1 Tax=Fistulina hepatica ATCC 64428 TaxID=1128425 RepID=A0A0D7AFN7_9AGAR|nr:hypothetical protein FISHEDRAFT_40970 [Fistulina hepatica ATCC 64428]
MLHRWTDDEILRNTHFCNPYRILDKTSQYIITNVIERGSQEPSETLFRILLFNTFTSISTYELLERTFGTPAWSTFDFHDYAEVLGDARARGKSLYTGRFQKTAADFGNATMYLNHLDLLQSMMESGLLLMCQNSRYAVEVYEWIAEHPGMGPFSSYQLMLNLAYSSLLHFHPNDFCVPGPGAESGLSKLFGASYRRAKQADREAPVMIIRHIVAHQAEYFAQFHLDFPYLVRPGTDGDTIQLDVCDIEHALCEVDRFARIVHPGVIGSAAAKSKTLPSFRPSYVDGIPRPYILPVAWADPRRQTPCLRPGSEVPGIVKRYIVDRIVKDKIDEKGNRLFLVRWLHYSPKDDTWEEELYLREDGLGQTIDNYLKNKKVHC